MRVPTFALSLLLACPAIVSAEANATGPDVDFSDLQSRIQSTVAKTMPAVVGCNIKGRPGGFSAVIVSKDGYILTAAHCVANGNKAKKAEYVVHLSDGRKTKAEALGFNRTLDCALMKITEEGEWPFAEMGDSDQIVQNQPCVGISHPEGHNAKRGAVVRFGRVRQIVTPRAGMIQTTCLIEPGDSGGPVFDFEGKIIGINSQIGKDLNANYQVSIATFEKYWEKLKKKGSFTPKGTPGVPLLGLNMSSSRKGIAVSKVTEDGIAAKAGVAKGDRIKRINDGRVMSSRQFMTQYIKLYQAGAKSLTVTITTGEDEPRDVVFELPERAPRSGTAMPELENLIQQAARLEDELDDTTLLIGSKQLTRSLSVYGTLVSDDGLIVSKASQVGDKDIYVKLRTGVRLDTEVLARDQQTDLVLLRCADLPSQRFASLEPLSEEPKKPGLGHILLTPNSRGPGCVSVLGSKTFASGDSAKSPPSAYLGVYWTGKPIKIVRVVPGTPADKAGLRLGDTIVSIRVHNSDGPGEEVQAKSLITMQKFLQPLKPGQYVLLKTKRGQAESMSRIQLIKRPYREIKRHAADFLVGGKSERRTGFKSAFTHDATIQQKECGGPVFDMQGNFVALNIAKHSRAQIYAVPADVVRAFVKEHTEDLEQ